MESLKHSLRAGEMTMGCCGDAREFVGSLRQGKEGKGTVRQTCLAKAKLRCRGLGNGTMGLWEYEVGGMESHMVFGPHPVQNKSNQNTMLIMCPSTLFMH